MVSVGLLHTRVGFPLPLPPLIGNEFSTETPPPSPQKELDRTSLTQWFSNFYTLGRTFSESIKFDSDLLFETTLYQDPPNCKEAPKSFILPVIQASIFILFLQ